ncbi:Shikimate O-hydroxycinnamoyltransferase [Acorus gramineus]|uniref:Shikimate O-hydroxycinnamoyltransferase n=1 Tax=Acorus gramineus TaxID=55184 RepID=A0AAV9B3G6_ACOGR|nr:Shikimate O-hydroxycinnamoyltransferase [Acorus gramineus]
MSPLPPPPQREDLKVTIKSSSLVHPPPPPPPPHEKKMRRSMFLSNIDQPYNVDIDTVYFFPPNKAFPPSSVCEAIERALRELLVPYDFLAGRLATDPVTGRREIDCNGAGAGFVVASSERTFEEVRELGYSYRAFRQLVPSRSSTGLHDWPLIVIQVTSFKCGAFAMGLSNNHITFDGASVKMFLQNLASIAGRGPLIIHPCNDRHLLAARSPPRVMYPHLELKKVEEKEEKATATKPVHIAQAMNDDLETKFFRLGPADIAKLKEKGRTTKVVPTSFNAVMTHVWRCKALSEVDNDDDDDREERSSLLSRVLYSVDLRTRLGPQVLPRSYTGNAVLRTYGAATYGQLEGGPFSSLVEIVREGLLRVTEDYVRSFVDMLGKYETVPNGDLIITTWWRLGIEEVEYPWGRPVSYYPVTRPRKHVVVLFPNVADFRNAVNIMVSLPPQHMVRFVRLFYSLLS